MSRAGAVACGAVSAVSGVGLLATSGWLITTASLRPPVLSLSVAIGAVQAFALSRGVARYGERLAVHDAALRRLGAMRLALFDRLEPLVPGGLGRATTGSLLSAYVADTEAVAMASARRFMAAVEVSAAIAVGVALAGVIDPVVAAALGGGAGLVLFAALATSRLDRRAAQGEAAVRAAVAEAATESVRSAVELVAYGRTDLVTTRLDELARRSAAAARRRGLAAGTSRGLALLAAGGALIAVLVTGLAAHRGGAVTGVELAVLAFDTLAVLEACSSLPDTLAATRAGAAGSARLAALGALAPPLEELAAPLATPPRPAGAALEEASVRSGDGTVLLERLSCAVAPGRSVALTGPSGAGKTTALHALLRFCRLESGRALVGGTDVAGLDRATLAARLGWVPEEPHLFSASLEANLRLGLPRGAEHATPPARLVEVLELVGHGSWLAGLPDGLATSLGTGGRRVSAGERQRLVLARALLGEPDVLLADEPTAHLDPATARTVSGALLQSCAGRALLIVTHDGELAAMADERVAIT